MEVAIMGAGLAGLACAITLEQHGVTPSIFEKKDRVGDTFVHMQAIPNMIRHPIGDSIKHLSEQYHIDLKPNSNIRHLFIIGTNQTAHLSGHLGFTNIRGRHPRSLENQLYNQLQTKIYFNSEYTYDQLLNNYTHVIMATGDAGDAIKLNNFHTALSINMKGATIKGTFDKQKVYMWLNNNFAPMGYSLLLPFSTTEANMVIGFPNAPDFVSRTNQLWTDFSSKIQEFIQNDIQITDSFEITNYVMGYALNPRIGNTLFVGNCLGALMPFMGLGQIESILTGIYAAQDLLGIGDYDALTKNMLKSNRDSIVLRKGISNLSNKGYDNLIQLINTQFSQSILKTEHLNILKFISKVIKPFV